MREKGQTPLDTAITDFQFTMSKAVESMLHRDHSMDQFPTMDFKATDMKHFA